MQPQLKDSMNFSARFFFNFCQGIHVPGIQNERFFTNCIGLLTQGKTDVRIVKVVWGTNANIIDLSTIPSEFVDMPVKSFKLRKKVGLWKMGINDPHTVKFVECRYQGVARVLDRLHVTRSNVSCRSDKSKVFHLPDFVTIPFLRLYFSSLSGQAAFPSASNLRRCPFSLIQPVCRAGFPITSE